MVCDLQRQKLSCRFYYVTPEVANDSNLTFFTKIHVYAAISSVQVGLSTCKLHERGIMHLLFDPGLIVLN